MATAPITRRPDAASSPGVGIAIVNYRTPALAIECLAALEVERDGFADFRVVVVDGDSGDGSADAIAQAIAAKGWGGWAELLALPVNGGFGYANNQAILRLRDGGGVPEFVLLLNPDARPRPGALMALARRMRSDPKIGAVGARLEHEDGTAQGSSFPWPTIAGEINRGARLDVLRRLLRVPAPVFWPAEAGPVDWVTGAAVMFRRDVLERVGLFDDGFFLYFEETELLWRIAAAGYGIWHEPAARVVHHAGKATRLRDPETGRLLPGRLPRYWYEARRRYFALTRGRVGGVAAGLAYLAGRLLWQARCALTGLEDAEPQRTTRDFIAYSLWPRGRDLQRNRVSLADPAGRKPGWMR
jgi:N-acetylglucosaminyl-diphospho-decaprenol L-rhamnosyltransferase